MEFHYLTANLPGMEMEAGDGHVSLTVCTVEGNIKTGRVADKSDTLLYRVRHLKELVKV